MTPPIASQLETTHAESFLNKNAAVPFRRFGDDLITPGSFEKFAKSTGANSQLTIKLIVNDVNLKNSGWGEYAAAFGDAAGTKAFKKRKDKDVVAEDGRHGVPLRVV